MRIRAGKLPLKIDFGDYSSSSSGAELDDASDQRSDIVVVQVSLGNAVFGIAKFAFALGLESDFQLE